MDGRFKMNNSVTGHLSSAKRQSSTFLIIDPDDRTAELLKRSLLTLNFGHCTSAPSHAKGLDKLKERPFTHIIFDARTTDMSPEEFLDKALVLEQGIVLIAASFDPTLDNVFDLLMKGARSYLVKPFAQSDVDEVICLATAGNPFPQFIGESSDRNKVFSMMTSHALDSLSEVQKQADRFESASRKVSGYKMQLNNAVRLGTTFGIDGAAGFSRALIDHFTECAGQPATALGKRRRQLSQKRQKSKTSKEKDSRRQETE